MRPVNLIPPEERRGDGAPARTGSLAYVVVGILAVAFAAVCGVVLLNKQASERKAEVVALEDRSAALEARAEKLARYTSFQQVHDDRVATVQQLAESRFDWERVLRELARVLPRHIWLTNLNGSVSAEAAAGESENPLRAEIEGPALELAGCGRSHRDVARLVAAMKDIDGVTRVSITDSAKSDQVTAPAAGGSEPLTSDDCQTRSTVPKFNLIAAFDGVVAEAGAVPPAAPAPAPGSPAPAPASDAPAPDASQAESRAAIDDAGQETESAANLVPGG